jgi:hypothetical protein
MDELLGIVHCRVRQHYLWKQLRSITVVGDETKYVVHAFSVAIARSSSC